jgi:hypothetical protein
VYLASFAVGTAAFALAFGGGLYRSLEADGRPPHVWEMYASHIDELIQQEALGPALQQLRVAATLDGGNERELLGVTVALARRVGDRETEVWALQRLVRLRPSDAALRQRLEEAEAQPR